MPKEGVVIVSEGAFIQGILGLAAKIGNYPDSVDGPGVPLEEKHIQSDDAGKIIVGGSLITAAAITKAAETGVRALVAGGIIDTDLIKYVGYDIGVAITGHEDVPVTIVIT